MSRCTPAGPVVGWTQPHAAQPTIATEQEINGEHAVRRTDRDRHRRRGRDRQRHCTHLAERGARIVGVDISETLTEALEALPGTGHLALPADISDQAAAA